MTPVNRRVLLAAALLTAAGPAAAARPLRILVFSGTSGFRHESIEAGVAAFQAMGAREGFTVTATEDPAVFSAAGLKDVDVLVLLSNTTDRKKPESEHLVGERRTALQAFVRRGGGVVGVHAASDSHHHWPWYGRMIGGRFARHPAGTPTGQVTIVDPNHPATRGLPRVQSRTDEWYYIDDYDPTRRLLMTLDPASIGEKDVNPKPMAWAHEFEGGRVFYTALGHTKGSFAEPYVLKHLSGAIRWAARR